jgi:site-specific recombinase XerD
MSLTQKLEDTMRLENLLPSTRKTYQFWVRALYRFNGKPASTWTSDDVRSWLLRLDRDLYSPVSRKQALNAVVFVFRHVLKRDLGQLNLPPMPRVHQTLRVVPSREELGRIFAGLKGQAKLMAALMYGSGLRVGCECVKLRVKDIDLAGLTVNVWEGKGDKCRRSVLPVMLVPALRRHLAWVKSIHDQDLANGGGLVELPGRLAVKYKSAPRDFSWQWLFPSNVVRGQYRWHATPESLRKQMRAAIKAAGITKVVTPHCLRHAFVTHGLQAGNDLPTMMKLVGHEDANTTMIYAHGDVAQGFSPMDAPVRTLPVVVDFTNLIA